MDNIKLDHADLTVCSFSSDSYKLLVIILSEKNFIIKKQKVNKVAYETMKDEYSLVEGIDEVNKAIKEQIAEAQKEADKTNEEICHFLACECLVKQREDCDKRWMLSLSRN